MFQTQSTDDLGLEKTKYICEHLSLFKHVFVIVFLVFVALTF